MSTFPLTPAKALAVAAMIDTHPNPLPHWAGWAKALRTWAAAEFDASQPVENRATPEGGPLFNVVITPAEPVVVIRRPRYPR